MNLTQPLIQYGLSYRESAIYLSLLKKVEVSVYEIAKDTKIPRTTVYETLELMRDKGIVSSTKTNGVMYFTAESPNRLMDLLKEKQEILQSTLPALLAFSNAKSEMPSVELYLGEEGMKRVYLDMIDTVRNATDKALYAIVSPQHSTRLPNYFNKVIKKREEYKIFRYLIAGDDGSHTIPNVYESNTFRETRLIPAKYLSDSTIDIYAGKVAIFSEKAGETHSIIIDSPSISEALKKFFFFMWDHARKYEETEKN